MSVALEPGQTLGPWHVQLALAAGAPALATAQRDDDPQHEVVLQVSRAEAWQARVVAVLQSLDHPTVPKLVDAGRAGALRYVAMRPFAAETLSERMFAGPIPLALACTWLHALADGLRAVHAAGWVHGDVAPHHLHVSDDGRAWILGLANARRRDEGPRGPSDLPTPALNHLAPEVLADPQHAPPRADIYAFGTVAYEMLAGEPAFPAAAWAGSPDQRQVLLTWKTRHRELDPGPNYPDWLRALVRKCTHPDAQERLPDFDSVVSWLEGSRPSWALTPVETPMPAPRVELPPLRLQPTMIDTEHLARAIAQQVQLQPEPRADLYVLVAAASGLAVGLALSILVIVYAELSRMG